MTTKVPIDELPSGPNHRRHSPVAAALLVAAAVILGVAWMYRPNQPVREGPLANVQWMSGPDRGRFLSRTNFGEVPGGNGSGSTRVDMRGRLFPDYLEVTVLGAGPDDVLIIPKDQLISATFGDAGIKDPRAGDPGGATTTAASP